MVKQGEIVERAIRRKHLTPDVMAEVESAGALAFDEITKALGSGELRGYEKINAIRLLSYISRERCSQRKPEVLERALELCTDESREVRSAAVHMVVTVNQILDGLTLHQVTSGARQDTVVAALRAALHRGLDPDYEDFVKKFLSETGRS